MECVTKFAYIHGDSKNENFMFANEKKRKFPLIHHNKSNNFFSLFKITKMPLLFNFHKKNVEKFEIRLILTFWKMFSNKISRFFRRILRKRNDIKLFRFFIQKIRKLEREKFFSRQTWRNFFFCWYKMKLFYFI